MEVGCSCMVGGELPCMEVGCSVGGELPCVEVR
jgi:hypothetical protein